MANTPKYDWEKWMSRKKRFVLIKGRDYHCMTHSMAQQIRTHASDVNRSVSIHIDAGVTDPKIEKLTVRFSN